MGLDPKNIDPEALSKRNVDTAMPLSQMFSLKGKVAIVTGGGSGLGYTVANRLAEAGASIVIASLGEARGRKAVEDFTAKGYTASWVATDVSLVADCYKAVDFAVKTYGHVDILVSNAAGWSSCSYLDVSEELYDKILDVDLKGSYVQVAAGGVADGSEMVIFDLLGFVSGQAQAKHGKYYANAFDDFFKANMTFDHEVKDQIYPAEEHGWGMDKAELDKFMNELDSKYPDVK